MHKTNKSKIAYLFSSMLVGMASFFISGVLACIVIWFYDNYILATIIAGGIGGLLLSLLLKMHKKISRMIIAGIIGMPIGLILSFFLVEGFGALFPSIGGNFENSSIPDIIAIMLMGIIFGAVFGAINYGRKSIRLFSIVCGVVSIPSGLLVAALNSGFFLKVWPASLTDILVKIDLNFLAITISIGIGTGLSIGLYNMSKQISTYDSIEDNKS